MEAAHPACPCCGEQAAYLCTGCSNLYYCSRECLETDLPAHAMLCSKFKDYANAPDAFCRRVIFFDPRAMDPVFLWLPLMQVKNSFGAVIGQTVFMLGTMGVYFPQRMCIEKNPLNGVALKDPIQLHWLASAFEFKAMENRPASRTTFGNTTFTWRGPMLAVCGRLGEVKNMDLQSFSSLAGFLQFYRNKAPIHTELFGPKISAVHILSDGECDADETCRYRAVPLPRFHPLVHSRCGDVSPISQRVGFPLVVVKLSWMNTTTIEHNGVLIEANKTGTTPGIHKDLLKPHLNAPATALQTSCDPHERVDFNSGQYGFGHAPLSWTNAPGTVLVFRPDFRPLDIPALKAFVAYCEKVRDMIRTMRTVAGAQRTREVRVRGENFVLGINARAWITFQAEWTEARKEEAKGIQEVQEGLAALMN